MNVAQTDEANYLAARDSSHTELLAYAAKKTGRSPFQIQREFGRVSKTPNKINMVEYVRTGLYDTERFSPEEEASFISNDLHWPITHTCNNKSWSGAAEDKALCGRILASGGVPVPDTVAVLDRSNRLYPDMPKVSEPEDLRALLNDHPDTKFFCKIVDGMVSFGAFQIERLEGDEVICAGHDPIALSEFFDRFVGDNAYLVQRVLRNHSALAPYASALATVRMVNLVRENDVYCPVAVIKLPQGENIADAFWRPGNLASEVDVETGEIKTVARRGIEMEYLEDHPSAPGLMGLTLPYWQELLQVNARAAQLYAPIKYQSTDVAITENGPVVVELNYGGGFDLPQYASGRGMLTAEVRAFFEGCGFQFNGEQKKKRGFFGRK